MSGFELPFCPSLVCPVNARVLGYPFVELPDGTTDVKGFRGFVPTRVTQWLPPGTVLGANSTTIVTLSASDDFNRTLTCNWTVVVPPLVKLGEVRKVLFVGTYNETNVINVTNETTEEYTPVIVPDEETLSRADKWTIFKMTARVQKKFRGRGKRESIAYPKSGDKYNGQLTVGPNQTRASILFRTPIHVKLRRGDHYIPNILLKTEVLQNSELNSDTTMLFGQIESWW
jgi:hypothetical protein